MRVAEVSGPFFPIFDDVITQGRAIGQSDERDDLAAIVVSADVWRQLDRSQGVGQTTCRIGSKTASTTVTIVGVVDSALQFPSGAQLWLPRAVNVASRPVFVNGAPGLPPVRSGTGWIALPKPGVGITQIKDEMLVLLSEANSELFRETGIRYGEIVAVSELVPMLTRTVRPGLVVLIASAVLAFLLCLGTVLVHAMSRLQARRRELAIQLSLGAPHHHGAMAVMAEAGLIALFSVGLILLTTSGLLQLARAYLAGFRVYLALDSTVWWPVVAVTVVATLLTALAAALGGSVAQRFLSPIEAARGAAGMHLVSGGARAVRRVFIGLSAAVATALIAGAIVANTALVQLLNLELGYTPAGVATVTLGLERSTISGAAFTSRRAEIASLAEARGIARAGFTNRLPVRAEERGYLFLGTGDGKIMAAVSRVDAAFFPALGIYVRGPGLSGAPNEIVVNESAADRLGAGQDILGSIVRFDGSEVPYRVVGIVGDTRTVDQGTATVLQIYLPHEEVDGTFMPLSSVVIELLGECTRACRGAIDSFIADIQRVPGTTVIRAEELPAVIGAARGNTTVAARLWTLYGLLALGIAVFAVVSMVHQNANRRRREIGIRLALGATRRRVFGVVAGEVLFAASVGSVVGAATVVLSTTLLENYVQGVVLPGATTLGLALMLIVLLALLAASTQVAAVMRLTPTQLLRISDAD
jgi:putative ABC transport system permease protein